MITARPAPALAGPTPAWRRALLALALLAWCAPIVVDMAAGPWRQPMHSHGPVVIGVALWLAWQRWRLWAASSQPAPDGAARAGGAAWMALALLSSALGRWGDVPMLQAAALAPALAGIAGLIGGRPLLRALAFPIGFLLFAIPMPSAWADALTQPMKLGVSAAAAALLGATGHPVWLDGVVLGIGPYRLLVADACAGLGSLLMLEAFGLLYLHLVRHPSLRRTAVLTLAIVPISLAANVVRVVLLALVTLHFGDAAGQGLVHRASGVILFAAALAMIGPLDLLLRRLSRHRGPGTAAPLPSAASAARPPMRHVGALALAFGTAAALNAAGPREVQAVPASPPLAQRLPERVGAWQVLPERGVAQVAAATEGEPVYDDLLVRSYRHADGRVVMLTLAYAHAQRRATRVHEPPVCYAAAGFRNVRGGRLSLADGVVAERFLAQRDGRREAVVWWSRLGRRADTPGAAAGAWSLFRQRLAGQVPDGLLVRASSLVPPQAAADDAATYAAPQAFLAALLALPPAAPQLR